MAMIARERFLSQASLSLQDSAPSLAQQLRLGLSSLQNASGASNLSDQDRFCPSCGSLDVESRTAELPKTNNKTQSSSNIPTDLGRTGIVIHKCRVCFRSEKVPVEESKPDPVQKLDTSTRDAKGGESNTNQGRDTKVQKTSSKKRAKERKDREGLQALLSKKPDMARPTKSFDLMDFLSSKS